MGERTPALVITIVVAVATLFCVSAALLLFDPRVTGADALRTGGLAAGSVVALYALWLNDRRRRVEENRQRLDRRRADLEHERIADERFARAVELLGHETDQVRVGALHALAGLARSNPQYIQTVLDVLCSYLRRPFSHPRYTAAAPEPSPGRNGPESAWSRDDTNDAERKLQVRLTAQRLIADLLPAADAPEAPAYDLDLTNATLEYFDLSGRKIGTLELRYAQLFSSNNFSRCVFTGPAWFTATKTGTGRMAGHFRCSGTVFRDRAWFSGVTFDGPVTFDGTRFLGRAKFSGSQLRERLSMVDAEFHEQADFRGIRLPAETDLSAATFHAAVLTADASAEGGHEITWPIGASPE